MKKKNNQISVKSLAEMYGYHEVTMHRYLQRAEFSKILYKHDGRQFRVVFTLDFKNRYGFSDTFEIDFWDV